METYGRITPKCNKRLLHQLTGQESTQQALLLQRADEELSVTLVKGNALCGWLVEAALGTGQPVGSGPDGRGAGRHALVMIVGSPLALLLLQ